MEYAYLENPVGNLLIAGSREALKLISFAKGSKNRKPQSGWVQAEKPFSEVVRQLRAYFSRDLRRFDLPLQPEGTTIQLAIWRRLQEIPFIHSGAQP